jgi:hypothetical protein
MSCTRSPGTGRARAASSSPSAATHVSTCRRSRSWCTPTRTRLSRGFAASSMACVVRWSSALSSSGTASGCSLTWIATSRPARGRGREPGRVVSGPAATPSTGPGAVRGCGRGRADRRCGGGVDRRVTRRRARRRRGERRTRRRRGGRGRRPGRPHGARPTCLGQEGLEFYGDALAGKPRLTQRLRLAESDFLEREQPAVVEDATVGRHALTRAPDTATGSIGELP